LLAAHVGCERGAFQHENPELRCPIEQGVIEVYLQILKPLYLLSLSFQRSGSSIADVVPGVLKCIDHLQRLQLSPLPKQLCAKLVSQLNHYFDFELNSPIYAAAMLLKVGCLKHWVSREWAKGFSSKGIIALMGVAKQFVFKKRFERPTNLTTLDAEANATEAAGTPVVQTPNGDIFFRFFEDDHENATHEAEIDAAELESLLKCEIENFTKLVRNLSFILNKKLSTREFWFQNRHQFPYLSEMALVLISITSSSAFIERFFSICGLISSKFTHIEDDLFEQRAMFRANSHILNEMNGN
jgi:hypothetical protein